MQWALWAALAPAVLCWTPMMPVTPGKEDGRRQKFCGPNYPESGVGPLPEENCDDGDYSLLDKVQGNSTHSFFSLRLPSKYAGKRIKSAYVSFQSNSWIVGGLLYVTGRSKQDVCDPNTYFASHVTIDGIPVHEACKSWIVDAKKTHLFTVVDEAGRYEWGKSYFEIRIKTSMIFFDDPTEYLCTCMQTKSVPEDQVPTTTTAPPTTAQVLEGPNAKARLSALSGASALIATGHEHSKVPQHLLGPNSEGLFHNIPDCMVNVTTLAEFTKCQDAMQWFPSSEAAIAHTNWTVVNTPAPNNFYRRVTDRLQEDML